MIGIGHFIHIKMMQRYVLIFISDQEYHLLCFYYSSHNNFLKIWPFTICMKFYIFKMPLGLYKLMQHTSFRKKVTKRWFKTIPNVPANLNNCKTFEFNRICYPQKRITLQKKPSSFWTCFLKYSWYNMFFKTNVSGFW